MPNFDSQVRQPRMSATIQYGNPIFDSSIVATATAGGDLYGTINQAKDGVTVPTKHFFTLGEGQLQNGFKLYTLGDEIGWKPSFQAASDGTMTSQPILTYTFSSRSINCVRVYGDVYRNAFPVAFTVVLSDGTNNYTVVNQTNNAQVGFIQTISPAKNNIISATLTITKWSLPFDYPAILEFACDNYYSLPWSKLVSADILRERRVEGQGIPYGTIAAHELQLSFLKDPTVPSANYRANVPIVLQTGTVDSGVETDIPAGTFYATAWDPSNEKVMSVIAHDWRYLLSLRTGYYLDLYNTKTVGQLVNGLLIAAGIPVGLWVISGLSYVPPVVAIPNMTYFAAIKLLLGCANGVSVMDNNGICTFKDDSFGSPVKTLTTALIRRESDAPDGTLSNPSDSGALATVIDVYYYNFTRDAALSNVIDTDQSIVVPASSSITVTINWTGANIAAVDALQAPVLTTAGGSLSITGTTVMPDGVAYVFTNSDPNNPSSINHITVQGYALHVAEQYYEASDANAINLYGRVAWPLDSKIAGYLIQSYTQAKALGDLLISKYNSPNKIWKIPARGDPSVIPDNVENSPTLEGSTINVQVERQQFSFASQGAGLKETTIARAQ